MNRLGETLGSILLVDDEPLVLEMFESVLRENGYQVSTALSSVKAIELLSRKTYNMLLTDVWLDEVDGFAVARSARLRSEAIAVTLITGRPNDADQARAEQLGYSYLSKPIPFEVLLENVRETMASSASSVSPHGPTAPSLTHLIDKA